MIELKHLSKSFETAGGRVDALKDVSLTIPDGDVYGIIGMSGAGKSTLVRCINMLERPTEGEVIVNGQRLDTMSPAQLRTARHDITMIFQRFNLLMQRNCLANVCFPMELSGLRGEKKWREQRALELLDIVGLKDKAKAYPAQLSGGQQQRIGVLRALAASPPIVLMDEPFGALDPQTREALQDEVKNLQQRLGKTIIFVTHDMDEALKLADIIIFMDGGEVVQMASPEEMLENPATERVRSFLGKHASGTQPPSKVEQFMRTNVQSVQRDRGILECAEQMARHSVDTLLVVDECNRYAGTVSIGDIRAWGKESKTIDPIIRQTARTVRIGDDAKESFDYLLESGASYVIVLNEDDTVAGIVTKTSVARAVAETLWGDEK